MAERIDRELGSPTLEREEPTHVARLLNIVLLTFIVVTLVVSILLLLVSRSPRTVPEKFAILFAVGMFVISLLLRFVARRGQVRVTSIVLLSLVYIGITTWIYISAGMVSDGSLLVYPLLIVLTGLLLGERATVILMSIVSVSLIGVWGVEFLGWKNYPGDPLPISTLIIILTVLVLFGLLFRFAVHNLQTALERARRNERIQKEANRELAAVRNTLEDRVASRTETLNRRARQLEAAVEIGRVAVTIRDVDKLLSTVAQLISERLDFYHVGIFMIDQMGGDQGNRYAVLRAASSEGGDLMVVRGHRLEIGRQGIVGYVAETGEPRIALDVGEDAMHFANPLLPYTRSEVALPIIASGQVLGVLDVQSSKEQAFEEQDVALLQVLADQLAIVIENTNLYIQTQSSMQAQRQLYGELSRDAWRQVVGASGDLGYLGDARGVNDTDRPWRPDMVQAYAEKSHIQTDDRTLALPITIRDHVEGVIRLAKEDDADGWTNDEIELMQSMAAQLSTVLDSARLYQETRERAASQQMLGEVTSQIRQTLDIETVLRTAAEQVRQALGLPEVIVQLSHIEGKESHAG